MGKKHLNILFLAGIFALFSAGSCLAEARPNVLIIVINALRPDYMGCYNAKQGNTPNIDALASEGICFDNAIGQSYWTLPSMVSLLTSKYVFSHQVNSRNTRISPQTTTFTEILKQQGFNTAAFTCGLDTIDRYGLEKGFDTYSYYSGAKPVGSLRDILPQIRGWLDKNKSTRFFALIHSYDLHPPYDNGLLASLPDRDYAGILAGSALDYGILKKIRGNILDSAGKRSLLDERDFEHIKNLYSAGIRRADSYVGEITAYLKENGLYEKTIIVLCADHGEELGERGSYNRFDNQNLFQETLHLPLIIRCPGEKSAKRRIKTMAGLIDLTPTLLDLLEINKPEGIDGLSLAGLLRGENRLPPRKFLAAEGQKGKLAILREDGWKLISVNGQNQLYNLAGDPGERRDLARDKPRLIKIILTDLLNWRQLHRADVTRSNYITLDAEMIDNLKKAGYW